MALKRNQWTTICRLESWSHLSIGWLLVWCHKGPAQGWWEVLWANFWTSWKAFIIRCVWAAPYPQPLFNISWCWFPEFPVLEEKTKMCSGMSRAEGLRAEEHFVLSCGGSEGWPGFWTKITEESREFLMNYGDLISLFGLVVSKNPQADPKLCESAGGSLWLWSWPQA